MIYKNRFEDFFFETTASTLDYMISTGGQVIFQGRAVKSPAKPVLRINVGQRVRDYLENEMPDFRDFDGVVVPHPDALLDFELQDVFGNPLETYRVLLDYTEDFTGSDMILSDPVNGHADPRQKLFIGCYSEIGEQTASTRDYLTIQMLEGGIDYRSRLYLQMSQKDDGYELFGFEYSVNGGDWHHFRTIASTYVGDNRRYVQVAESVEKGDIIRIRRYQSSHQFRAYKIYAQDDRYSPSKPLPFNVYGNLTSLLITGDTFEGYERYITQDENHYSDELSLLFSESAVVSARNLYFPTDAVPCNLMFNKCYSLTKAPAYLLPKLMTGCYYCMFKDLLRLKNLLF